MIVSKNNNPGSTLQLATVGQSNVAQKAGVWLRPLCYAISVYFDVYFTTRGRHLDVLR